MCGALLRVRAPQPQPGPTNLFQTVANDLTLRGFRASVYLHLQPEAINRSGHGSRRAASGTSETIVDGLERAPEALIRMMTGDTVGKTLVRVAGPTVTAV